MSLKTRIRFVDPVDPREVWVRVLEILDPPAGYRWSNVPVGGNDIAWRNPLIYAESGQGAAVWAYVMYGPEGSLLRFDEEDDGPDAYVEVSLISDWESVEYHAHIACALGAWIPVCQKDDIQNEWHAIGEFSHEQIARIYAGGLARGVEF